MCLAVVVVKVVEVEWLGCLSGTVSRKQSCVLVGLLVMKTIFLAAVFAVAATGACAQSKNKAADTAKSNAATAPGPFRMHFNQLFRQNADASYSPVQPLMINGEMVPTSTRLKNGLKYGGLDLMANSGRDLLVDTLRGVVIVHGFAK